MRFYKKAIQGFAVGASLLALSATANNLFFTDNVISLEQEDENYLKIRANNIFHLKESNQAFKNTFRVPEGYKLNEIKENNLKYEIIEPYKIETKNIVLQFHGGGYVLPLGNGHRNLGFVQSMLLGNAKTYLLDYDIAPQYQFPVALNQAIDLYQKILNEGYSAQDIIVIGDSAGANLTLSFALKLKELKLQQPKALVLVSPWMTMENDLPSRSFNFEKDVVLGKYGSALSELVAKPNYTTEDNFKNPLVSPIYGDFKGLAPMLIQVGGYETFLSEAKIVANKAKEQGVLVKLSVYDKMSHDWPLVFPDLKQSRDSWHEIKEFVEKLDNR